MSIREFFHHLFNPHCHHCAEEKEQASVCRSCEILKLQLEIANIEKQKLLDALLRRDEPVAPPVQENIPIRPRHVSWPVRRQMLEAEDRKAAQVRAANALQTETTIAPADDPDVQALEKEMKIVEESRESTNGKRT